MYSRWLLTGSNQKKSLQSRTFSPLKAQSNQSRKISCKQLLINRQYLQINYRLLINNYEPQYPKTRPIRTIRLYLIGLTSSTLQVARRGYIVSFLIILKAITPIRAMQTTRITFTRLFYKLLQLCTCLKECKRLPRPYNPINIKEEEWSQIVTSKLLDILGYNNIVKLLLLYI